MNKWVLLVSGAWLSSGACVVREEPVFGNSCEETRRECNVGYSGLSGYFRTCSTMQRPCYDNVGSEKETPGAGGSPNADSEDGEATDAPAKPAGDEVGVATPVDPTRYSAFDIPCERDSQCGPGKCIEGDCFYGCHSDAQCGSGDRCAIESGTRICRPDPNPQIECTRAAQCGDGSTCLNGACRQTCASTEQCTNVLDRCVRGICEPDRRPLSECVLNIECGDGFVCLDGACVAACAAEEDAGACLDEARSDQNDTPSGTKPSEPANPTPPAPANDGEAGEDDDDGDAPEPEPEDDPTVDTAPDAGAGLPQIQ